MIEKQKYLKKDVIKYAPRILIWIALISVLLFGASVAVAGETSLSLPEAGVVSKTTLADLISYAYQNIACCNFMHTVYDNV